MYKNYIANSILIIFFFLNVNKKKEENSYFFFSGQFHIGFVRIKQADYKKTPFFYLSTSYQTHNKDRKKDKVSRPDPLNDASIRYSDI